MTSRDLEDLLSPEFMVRQIIRVHRFIRRSIAASPAGAFESYFFETSRGLKPLTVVDLFAERMFMDIIHTHFGSDRILVLGEESLREDVDLTNEERTCVLIDMIDGTDLLRRGFSNWCSAVAVFSPRERRIEGAYVALPNRSLYYATADEPGARKVALSEASLKGAKGPQELPGPSADADLSKATVCTYAQKPRNLQEVSRLLLRPQVQSWLQTATESRFYSLAGNPMMIRVPEGTVDLVFELRGQAPHDMIPGAFIATKAGAVLTGLDGSPLGEEELTRRLCRPAHAGARLTYLLAANAGLADEAAALLGP